MFTTSLVPSRSLKQHSSFVLSLSRSRRGVSGCIAGETRTGVPYLPQTRRFGSPFEVRAIFRMVFHSANCETTNNICKSVLICLHLNHINFSDDTSYWGNAVCIHYIYIYTSVHWFEGGRLVVIYGNRMYVVACWWTLHPTLLHTHSVGLLKPSLEYAKLAETPVSPTN